jgi:hypothetical protein
MILSSAALICTLLSYTIPSCYGTSIKLVYYTTSTAGFTMNLLSTQLSSRRLAVVRKRAYPLPNFKSNLIIAHQVRVRRASDEIRAAAFMGLYDIRRFPIFIWRQHIYGCSLLAKEAQTYNACIC